MIAAAHATTSYNILTWVVVGTSIVSFITAAAAALSFRALKRTTNEPPRTTLPELFRHQLGRRHEPAARD
jgi:hypothetical protein